VEKCCRAGRNPDVNMTNAHCMLDNQDYKTHSEYVILIAFPHSNGSTNAPQCYVVRTLVMFGSIPLCVYNNQCMLCLDGITYTDCCAYIACLVADGKGSTRIKHDGNPTFTSQ
jgi:hypothetical protein